MRALPIVVTALLVAGATLAPAPSASAHSQLSESVPAAGSKGSTSPLQVVLRFNDGVLPQYADVAVAVDGGADVPVPIEVDADTVTADVTALAPAAGGTGAPVPWTVSYRVVSADGHPITGEVAFAAPPPSVPQPVTPAPSATAMPSTSPTTSAPQAAEGPTSAPPAAASDGSSDAVYGVPLIAVVAVAAVGLAAGVLLVLVRRRRDRAQ